MRWPGFLGGAWQGSVRTERCPFCSRYQSIARQSLPFSVICKDCGKTYQVTEGGIIASRPRDR